MKKIIFKFIPYKNGFIPPPNVKTIKIWENNVDAAETIFLGEIDKSFVDNKDLPKNVIGVVSEKKIKSHFETKKNKTVKKNKRSLYKKYCDKYFIEAFREKELGDSTKWDAYIKRVEKIKNLKSTKDKLKFNDVLND
jgi:hypothetical protein